MIFPVNSLNSGGKAQAWLWLGAALVAEIHFSFSMHAILAIPFLAKDVHMYMYLSLVTEWGGETLTL